MKYLKMFESLFGSYHKVKNDDIDYKKIIDIDERVKNTIENRLKHNSVFSYTRYQPYMGSNIRAIDKRKLKIETEIVITGGSPDGMVKPLTKNFNTLIAEIEDEWFYVCHQTKFEGRGSWYTKDIKPTIELYKCDQIEGLMELLKKLDVIR